MSGGLKQQNMKFNEKQKHKICDLIEQSLNSAKLQNTKDEYGNGFPLVDILTTGETTKEGQEEITNIVEQIYFDMDDWDI